MRDIEAYNVDRPASSEASQVSAIWIPSWFPNSNNPMDGMFIREQAECVATQVNLAIVVVRIRGLKAVLDGWPIFRRTTDRAPAGAVGIESWELANPFPGLPKLYARLHSWFARSSYRRFAAGLPRPLVVHSHVIFPGALIGDALSRWLGVPHLVSLHYSGIRSYLASPLADQLREAVQRADRVIVPSGKMGELAEPFTGARSLVKIPNPVDLAVFRPCAESRPGRLLAVARLHPPKNLPLLLEGFARARRRSPVPLHLDIVGEGPERTRLEVMIARLGLGESVELSGACDHNLLPGKISRSDFLVLSSPVETFGIVVIESMACGRPIVATRCGGPEEIITPEVGILVAEQNPDSLAEGILSMVHNRRRYHEERIRRAARAYSLERYGRRLVELYRETVQEHGGQRP
ncbi:MAG: glycosyltransferase [Candidatus Eisenbacteria bacterium]|nr:glycosyltransferase [Candidatus Eisenbacteria bacterium]